MEIRREGPQWAWQSWRESKVSLQDAVWHQKKMTDTSLMLLFPKRHTGCQNLWWETSELCVLGFGLHTPGLGIWLVSRTQSLCNFAIALFSPIFSSCYTFPVGHWVSPATLLSLANSCTVQNHWGAEVALVCFHSILWGFRSCDNSWVLPALEHGRLSLLFILS